MVYLWNPEVFWEKPRGLAILPYTSQFGLTAHPTQGYSLSLMPRRGEANASFHGHPTGSDEDKIGFVFENFQTS